VERNDFFRSHALVNQIAAHKGRFIERLLARTLQIVGEHPTIPVERDRGIHSESFPVSAP
jgi:hypothetical protein